MKHKRQLVEYWFDKAEESLDSANSEILAGPLTFAVNRLAYEQLMAENIDFLYDTTYDPIIL